VSAVAKEMGLVEPTWRNWVNAFDAGKFNDPGAKQATPEAMELVHQTAGLDRRDRAGRRRSRVAAWP
jgi:transposase-like protein